MHELSLMQDIVEACSARADGAPVKRVTVEIGKLSCVVPDALAFCFDVCTQDTSLAGSWLEIVRLPARARCRRCGAVFALNDLLEGCGCGSYDLEIISGQELRIKEMELA